MRTTIPLVITFVVGIFMLGEYFIPHWQYQQVKVQILEFGTVVAASAFFLGVINLLQVNFRPLSRGARSATLRITSNDPSRNVYEVALEGTGGQFKLLGIERDGSDTLINFSTSSSLGSYIYRILHSTDMQNWEPVGSIFSSGRETLQFRHRNSTGEAKAFWHVEEVRF